MDDAGEPTSSDRPSAPARPPDRETPGLTADGRLKSGRLAGRTMRSAMWVLSWPIMVESFLNSLVGLTDTTLSAGLPEGQDAADAVSAAAYVIWLVALVDMAIGVGATALVSRATGAGRRAVADAATGQTLLLAAVAGVVMGLIVVVVAGPVADLFGLTGRGRDLFVVYLRYQGASVPFLSLLFCGIACARGAGDSIRPLRSMVIVNVVNIAVSWILAGVDLTSTRFVDGAPVTRVILANPFDFDLGIAGVAMGTVAGYAVGAIVVIHMLARGSSGVRLRRRRMRPHGVTLSRLVRVGVPNFMETFGLWFGNFLIILMVARLGASLPGAMGAHMVGIRIEAFSFMPGFAMGSAAATLVGQYLGAGSPRLARRAVWVCTGVASAFMGVAGVALMVVPGPLVGLLTPQPSHLALTPPLLIVAGLVQVPFAASIVLRSALRGAGDTRVVMWLTWITTYAVRLPLAYVLSGLELTLPAWLGSGVIPSPLGLRPSLTMLWVGLCAEIIIRGAVFLIRFRQEGWARTRV